MKIRAIRVKSLIFAPQIDTFKQINIQWQQLRNNSA